MIIVRKYHFFSLFSLFSLGLLQNAATAPFVILISGFICRGDHWSSAEKGHFSDFLKENNLYFRLGKIIGRPRVSPTGVFLHTQTAPEASGAVILIS